MFIMYNVHFTLIQFLFLKFHMYICKSDRLQNKELTYLLTYLQRGLLADEDPNTIKRK